MASEPIAELLKNKRTFENWSNLMISKIHICLVIDGVLFLEVRLWPQVRRPDGQEKALVGGALVKYVKPGEFSITNSHQELRFSLVV